MKVVISQPMFFPWVGIFEQVRLADVFIHYDDVQFSKRSFMSRVQIKTAHGSQWLTVPLRDVHITQKINEVQLSAEDWRRQHLETLARVYKAAPHVDEMLALVREVYALETSHLCELTIRSMEAAWDYFDIAAGKRILRSSDMNIPGRSSQRLLDIVKAVGGTTYITGHGALNYLDHELFEREGITVEYIDYEKRPYAQLYGEFTPFVSILDLIANEGKAGERVIASGTKHWREFAK